MTAGELAKRTRADQGLPANVEDAATLAKIAMLLLDSSQEARDAA